MLISKLISKPISKPMSKRIITMSRLGTYGQWGNQIIQYAFVRTYARRQDLDYQLPQWAGQYFYGHDDPPLTAKLKTYHERTEPARYEQCFGVPIPPGDEEVVNRDWLGWGQFHTSWYAPDREFIQGLYDPVVEPEQSRVSAALDRLRKLGDTIIALHLRRSDGGRMIFFHTPIIWCLRWLRENWERFDRPVLLITTEAPRLVNYFRNYSPCTAEQLGIRFRPLPPPHYDFPHKRANPQPRQLDFFPDWYLLQQSDVILASESSFSVSAAMAGRRVREFWRPRLSLGDFEQVDPWNTDFSPREHLNDYPGIPGTQLDANPDYADYWRGYNCKYPAVPEPEEEIEKWANPSLNKQ